MAPIGEGASKETCSKLEASRKTQPGPLFQNKDRRGTGGSDSAIEKGRGPKESGRTWEWIDELVWTANHQHSSTRKRASSDNQSAGDATRC
jgi:hypothetical protein